jgi:hypothetical protein
LLISVQTFGKQMAGKAEGLTVASDKLLPEIE